MNSWDHCTSTPHTGRTLMGSVRRIKEGTSAVLLHSGLDEKWWADSMDCYCYLRNIQDLLSDGKTPCERRRQQEKSSRLCGRTGTFGHHQVWLSQWRARAAGSRCFSQESENRWSHHVGCVANVQLSVVLTPVCGERDSLGCGSQRVTVDSFNKGIRK